MKNKLFVHNSLKKQVEERGKENPSVNPCEFFCLNGNNVITAKVSDHHPLIHDDVLFWNMMMQGKMRKSSTGIGYNNGFGFIENDEQYMHRLIKVANVIAEMVFHNPSIKTIGICEGPIQSLHVNILFQALEKFPWMKRFMAHNTFYQPNIDGCPNWGILMMTDKNNQVTEIACDFIRFSSHFAKLANRFQLWKLTNNRKDKYFALAHFPFGGDENVVEKNKLSTAGNAYAQFINELINRYANEHFIFCADFNFNPYLINQWQDRILDQVTHNNSVLLDIEESSKKTIKTVTVDGILLSQKAKQKNYTAKYSPHLFGKLMQESDLFGSCFNTHLENNRHSDSRIQQEYDKCFGLVSCQN